MPEGPAKKAAMQQLEKIMARANGNGNVQRKGPTPKKPSRQVTEVNNESDVNGDEAEIDESSSKPMASFGKGSV